MDRSTLGERASHGQIYCEMRESHGQINLMRESHGQIYLMMREPAMDRSTLEREPAMARSTL